MIKEQEYQKFFTSVVIPYCLSISNEKQMHIVVDNQDKLVHASEEYLHKMNYTNLDSISGTTFEDIYQLRDRYPHLYQKYQQIKAAVVKDKQEINYLCVMELNDNLSFNVAQQTPLYHPNGDVIGSLTTIEDLATAFHYQMNNYSLYKLSKRQAEIIFLLTLGASQKEIAHIFKVSRGTISSSIDQICIKLKISGSSEKSVIKSALELGIGSIPIESLTPCIVPIHSLYDNAHAIKHLFNM